MFDALNKAVDQLLQNLTGIPFARKNELDEFYSMIVRNIRPIVERKLREKTGIDDLKKAKAKFELIDFDVFDPPKWKDARSEKSQAEYAFKTMEVLFTCIRTFNITDADGIKIQKLRMAYQQLKDDYPSLK